MTQVALPVAARDRLLDRFGPVAAAWIDDFGALVGELCQKWALEPQAVHAGGTGAVVECVSNSGGTRYALKLSPDSTVTEQEAAALTYWTDAPTVVDLVDADASRSAILLEWLPESTELPAAAWCIADVAGLIGDLYLPRGTLSADVDLTDLAMTGAGSEADIRRRCRELADIADPIDADRLWNWCCNFAPIMAVSLVRRAAKTGDVTLMCTLAHTR